MNHNAHIIETRKAAARMGDYKLYSYCRFDWANDIEPQRVDTPADMTADIVLVAIVTVLTIAAVIVWAVR